MPLINCKVELSLKWYENCILSSEDGNSVFAITHTKLYAPIVNLSAEENVKLGEVFKRPIYWNKYNIIPNETYAANGYIRELLNSSDQRVKRLSVLAYDNANGITSDSHKRYFLPRIEMKDYNIEIDGRNFYDQPINDLIKQYDKIKKISTGQGDDYTTVCLLDFAYFKKDFELIAVDLSKQKALDADSRAVQQITFTGTASAVVIIYYILEKSKETMLEFAKGTTKVS